jgi:hypothetical protein
MSSIRRIAYLPAIVVWNVVAAVASVAAAFAALVTVRLTIGYRREERLRRLAEALTAVVVAGEDHPGRNGSPVEVAKADARLRAALREVDRVAALGLLGLSARVTEPVVDLMDPGVRNDPQMAFMLGTRAFQQLLTEHSPRRTRRQWRELFGKSDGKDTGSDDGGQS